MTIDDMIRNANLSAAADRAELSDAMEEAGRQHEAQALRQPGTVAVVTDEGINRRDDQVIALSLALSVIASDSKAAPDFDPVCYDRARRLPRRPASRWRYVRTPARDSARRLQIVPWWEVPVLDVWHPFARCKLAEWLTRGPGFRLDLQGVEITDRHPDRRGCWEVLPVPKGMRPEQCLTPFPHILPAVLFPEYDASRNGGRPMYFQCPSRTSSVALSRRADLMPVMPLSDLDFVYGEDLSRRCLAWAERERGRRELEQMRRMERHFVAGPAPFPDF